MTVKKLTLAGLSILLCLAMTAPARAAGSLRGPERLRSEFLQYALQYWIYLPDGEASGLPELYVTDGHAYLSSGRMVEVLDREISAGRIEPLAVVFVDSRDPDNPEIDRRNQQFMCNADFGRFFLGELLPTVSARWTGAGPATRRGLQGVSFGAINAACFGLMLPGVFDVLILQSPGSDQHLEIVREKYEKSPRQPAALFVSHGGRYDNEASARRFVQALQRNGYPVRHLSNNGGHDWDNWRPLIDDALRAFVGLEAGDRVDER